MYCCVSALMCVMRRGEQPDPWSHREFLPKQWQDIVTMRMLLRGLPSESPETLPGTTSRSCFAAKWHMPHSEHAQHFVVSEAGLFMQ
jgi:hypothetical protein